MNVARHEYMARLQIYFEGRKILAFKQIIAVAFSINIMR